MKKGAAEPVRKQLNVPGCRSLIRWDKESCRPGEEPKVETHFFISSLEPDKGSAAQFQEMILRHWEGENCLHCVKEVDFREDTHGIRSGWGAVWTSLTSMVGSLCRLLRKKERTLRDVREKGRNKPENTEKILGWNKKN